MRNIYLFALSLSSFLLFSQQNDFTNGANDGGVWNSSSNWSLNHKPQGSETAVINGSYSVIISQDQTVPSLFVAGGATLTIQTTGSLTTTGNLTIFSGSSLTLESSSNEFSSLIVGGTSSGNVTYKRHVNVASTGNWDLVGSPVIGETLFGFTSDNSGDLAISPNDSNTYGVAWYNNSGSGQTWNFYTSNDLFSAQLNNGQGYQMGTQSSSRTLEFKGTVPIGGSSGISVAVQDNFSNGGSGTFFNLIANPYTSYIKFYETGESNNFLEDNQDILRTNYKQIFAHRGNPSDNTWEIFNNTTTGVSIAPGQAFFVAAGTNGNIVFNEDTQTVDGSDDFVDNRLANTSSEFTLRLYEEDNYITYSRFYFDDGLSLGLDEGYDAGGFSQDDDLLSRLIEDDQGLGLAINAMGNNNLADGIIVPLVINRDEGIPFEISLEDSTISSNIDIYLEDTLNETFTNLRDENFTLNPNSSLNDMGRFYLRIGNNALSDIDVEESYISVYKPLTNNNIIIEGLSNTQNANVKLFNSLGQEIISKTLNTNQSTEILSTIGIATGVYIIKLEADESVITSKIIIK